MAASNTNILLVEGKDDLYVLANLLQHHLGRDRVEEIINIQPKDSVEKLLVGLRNDLQRSELLRLGIIVDADLDLMARWAALRDRLHNLSDIIVGDIPDVPNPYGTILTASRQDRSIRVGLWLMPDNQQQGMLEDFVQLLVPIGDRLWPQAKEAVASIPSPERRFGIHQSKAEIHTWLAWQAEPGKPLGLAIRARYLDPSTSYAHQLVDWVKQLFEL